MMCPAFMNSEYTEIHTEKYFYMVRIDDLLQQIEAGEF
jgi:hypothetical protein